MGDGRGDQRCVAYPQRLRDDFGEKQHRDREDDREDPQRARVEDVRVAGAGDGCTNRVRRGVEDQYRCDRHVHVLFEAGEQPGGAAVAPTQNLDLRPGERQQHGLEYGTQEGYDENDANGGYEDQHDASTGEARHCRPGPVRMQADGGPGAVLNGLLLEAIERAGGFRRGIAIRMHNLCTAFNTGVTQVGIYHYGASSRLDVTCNMVI